MDGRTLKMLQAAVDRVTRKRVEHTHRWRQVNGTNLYECAEPRCSEVGFWVPKRTDG